MCIAEEEEEEVAGVVENTLTIPLSMSSWAVNTLVAMATEAKLLSSSSSWLSVSESLIESGFFTSSRL